MFIHNAPCKFYVAQHISAHRNYGLNISFFIVIMEDESYLASRIWIVIHSSVVQVLYAQMQVLHNAIFLSIGQLMHNVTLKKKGLIFLLLPISMDDESLPWIIFLVFF